MKKITALMLVACTLVLASGCGSDDASTKAASDREAVTTAPETPDPGLEPEAVPAIIVESPSMLASVHGSFTLSGTAKVHEGTIAWVILDASGKPLAQGVTTASCGAPCRGKFSTKVNVAKVRPGSWELHVYRPPVDDSDPARGDDTMVPITITSEPIDANTPGVDAQPTDVPTG